MAQKPRGAPPFAWTPEIEADIFGRIMRGESVNHILGDGRNDFLPSDRTFYSRLVSDADFFQRYAVAREAQGHREADEMKTIADNATPENVQVARLQIDARKWRASKLAPKSYGDKLELGGSGDGGAIVTQTIIRTIVDPKPDGGA